MLGRSKNEKGENKSQNPTIIDEVTMKHPNEAEQQKELSDMASILEQCTQQLSNLFYNDEIWFNVRKVADQNEELVQNIRATLDESQNAKEINDENQAYLLQVSQRRMLYDDFIGNSNEESSIYIKPEEVNNFKAAVQQLETMFLQQSSAQGLKAEVNTIAEGNVINTYISKLKDSLQKGYKIMAESCIDILKYYLTVGFNEINEFDELAVQQRLEYRHDFMNDTARKLINSIESYYNDLNGLRNIDAQYTYSTKLWNENKQKIEACPPEVKDILKNADIPEIAKQIKPGSPYRYMIYVVQYARTHLTNLNVLAYSIDSYLNTLSSLKADIHDLLYKMQEAYNDNGKKFDLNSHIEGMRQLKKQQIENANERNMLVKKRQALNDEVEGLVEAAAYDQEMMDNAAVGLRKVTKQIKIEQQNKKIIASILEAQKNKPASVPVSIPISVQKVENDDENNQQLLGAE